MSLSLSLLLRPLLFLFLSLLPLSSPHFPLCPSAVQSLPCPLRHLADSVYLPSGPDQEHHPKLVSSPLPSPPFLLFSLSLSLSLFD
ncbi:MAG: hypothetical protein J3Q66DRAFT_338203, partial [Benniella sp.]